MTTLGIKYSKESCKKMSEGQKKRYAKTGASPLLGRPRTDETKRKISLANAGKTGLRKEIEFFINQNGCHICTSHTPIKSNGGYPRCWLNGRSITMHRHIYLKEKGEIPENIQVRHTCDEPLCININHLILGTIVDNMRDKVERNRQAKGEQNGNSKLTAIQVKEIFTSREKVKNIAKKHNVSERNIYDIKSGRIWKQITGDISF